MSCSDSVSTLVPDSDELLDYDIAQLPPALPPPGLSFSVSFSDSVSTLVPEFDVALDHGTSEKRHPLDHANDSPYVGPDDSKALQLKEKIGELFLSKDVQDLAEPGDLAVSLQIKRPSDNCRVTITELLPLLQSMRSLKHLKLDSVIANLKEHPSASKRPNSIELKKLAKLDLRDNPYAVAEILDKLNISPWTLFVRCCDVDPGNNRVGIWGDVGKDFGDSEQALLRVLGTKFTDKDLADTVFSIILHESNDGTIEIHGGRPDHSGSLFHMSTRPLPSYWILGLMSELPPKLHSDVPVRVDESKTARQLLRCATRSLSPALCACVVDLQVSLSPESHSERAVPVLEQVIELREVAALLPNVISLTVADTSGWDIPFLAAHWLDTPQHALPFPKLSSLSLRSGCFCGPLCVPVEGSNHTRLDAVLKMLEIRKNAEKPLQKLFFLGAADILGTPDKHTGVPRQMSEQYPRMKFRVVGNNDMDGYLTNCRFVPLWLHNRRHKHPSPPYSTTKNGFQKKKAGVE
ncbi:hypothetical protein EIP91_010891 [Steccherinum ochraceum]|uniref:Uncharacterized protein n=1 Tax=Steccherinum ochraceum TaxID=92696 RepID=A0A4R0RMI2_9APHY|nr:hypothetical protein EIP91_010891 [Steccherinum ochraceum]